MILYNKEKYERKSKDVRSSSNTFTDLHFRTDRYSNDGFNFSNRTKTETRVAVDCSILGITYYQEYL